MRVASNPAKEGFDCCMWIVDCLVCIRLKFSFDLLPAIAIIVLVQLFS